MLRVSESSHKRRSALRLSAAPFLLALLLAGAPLASQSPATEETSGGGRILTEDLRPADGASVRILNQPPESGSFELETDPEGRFRFEERPLTPWVEIKVSWEPFYLPAEVEIPSSLLAQRDLELLLDPIRVTLTGRVELDGEAVPGAGLFALSEGRGVFLTAADREGRLREEGVPLELFGHPERGEVAVRLPDRLTFAGRFEEGPGLLRAIDLADRAIDVGVFAFHRTEPPPGEARLSGRLYVRDSLDPKRVAPIGGLILEAVGGASGEPVARTETDAEGGWSLSLAPGIYSFRAPNAKDLGFMPVRDPARPIAAGREGIDNGLVRFVPAVRRLEPRKIEFSYPPIPGLEIEEVVLRLDGRVDRAVPMSDVRREDRNGYALALPAALAPGAAVEVAVRVGGLLTLFSPSQAVPGSMEPMGSIP